VLQLHDNVWAGVTNMRVIEHPKPFILLGADVLSGGKGDGAWNFAGLQVRTLGAGSVVGSLSFEMGGTILEVDLPHAPVG
jgi:hypothetical protein